jgi:septum formation protein
MKTIILASSSPRRKELLEKTGLAFTVDPSDFKEVINQALEPHELVEQIAAAKAKTAAARHENAIIIAADTIGVLEGKIIGKPRTPAEARDILFDLNGKPHLVITGLCIIDTGTGKTVTLTVDTTVFFKNLSPEDIDAYVKTGEPLDKAGAYAIQGRGVFLVEKIVGDYYNVVGLPLGVLAESLKEFGIHVL